MTSINTLEPHCSKACNQNANDDVITIIVEGTIELNEEMETSKTKVGVKFFTLPRQYL